MKQPQNLTKQLFLLSRVKTSGRCFQIFGAFSEKLYFREVMSVRKNDSKFQNTASLLADIQIWINFHPSINPVFKTCMSINHKVCFW